MWTDLKSVYSACVTLLVGFILVESDLQSKNIYPSLHLQQVHIQRREVVKEDKSILGKFIVSVRIYDALVKFNGKLFNIGKILFPSIQFPFSYIMSSFFFFVSLLNIPQTKPRRQIISMWKIQYKKRKISIPPYKEFSFHSRPP